MAATAAAKEKQAKLSFFAGALFLLAGALNVFVALHKPGAGSNGLGAMLSCVGLLWIAIGARNRREARALAATEALGRGEI